MRRQSITLIALFGLGYAAFLGYSYLNRTQPGHALPVDASSASSPQQAPPSMPASASNAEPAAVSAEPRSRTVDELTTDTKSDDADKRAAAIAALASLPKPEAIPALRQVLTSGGGPERKLALSSLRTLAAQQGDTDGAIVTVLREAIYHTGDEETARAAQATLDDVEQVTRSR